MMRLSRVLALFFVATSPLMAIEFTLLEASQGRNTRPEFPDAYTDIIQTEDGYRFEIMTIESGDLIDFSVLFDVESGGPWLKMTVDEVSEGITGPPYATTIEFDPWHSPDPSVLHAPSQELVFPPNEPIAITFLANANLRAPEAALVMFEFSVEEIPIPFPADFNYDNVVDFGDFLVLSRNFNAATLGAFPWHYAGDANMDGITDFADFMILSESFGTVREAEPSVAAVPEPSAWQLVACLPLLLALRRRRTK